MNSAHPQMSQSRVFAAYLGDIRFEMVKMIRTPMFVIPTLLFPMMFFVLFGIFMGSARGNGQMSQFAFSAYGVFGTIAPGLFGFGVSLAVEREQGLLTFRQAIPMPAGSYLLARMVMAMMFVAIVSTYMIALAVFVAHVPLTFTQCVAAFFVNVFGVLPFCAIGLYMGSLVSGQAAPAIVNLIYLLMAFLSGLWVPMQFLGKTLQQLAPIWPAHHLLQLSFAASGSPFMGSTANHIGALAGVTFLFYFLAVRQLGGRGVRPFGGARAGFAFPLRRAFSVGMTSIAVGLVIAGIIGGSAPHAAASPAATSKDVTEDDAASAATDATPSAPLGVAAPDIALIADFDHGSDAASYGMGWHSADDKDRGGNSTISQRLVEGGARNSRGALEVSGEVGTALQYPFVGTSFLPNGIEDAEWASQGLMDYSAKKTLSFYARGDGQSYTVVIMGPALDAIPAMFPFVAGADWQAVSIPLQGLTSVDMKRVKLISIGSMTPGPFRLQIDDVRLD
jgi:ABC-2 type transport system permease protein